MVAIVAGMAAAERVEKVVAAMGEAMGGAVREVARAVVREVVRAAEETVVAAMVTVASTVVARAVVAWVVAARRELPRPLSSRRAHSQVRESGILTMKCRRSLPQSLP